MKMFAQLYIKYMYLLLLSARVPERQKKMVG